MSVNKVMTAEEAVAMIRDHDTIAVCGCENLLLPDKVLQALEARFLSVGRPKYLTEYHPVIYGMGPRLGLEHLAHDGLVARSIGSGFSYLKTSCMSQMLREGRIEAYVAPMGTLYQMFQNTAAGYKYTLTQVGLNTFVDPRLEGGCMNSTTPNTLAEIVEFKGEDYLCYKTPCVDIAIIRGTTADEYGNVSLEEEPVTLGILSLAMAARASGGKVIVQVKRLAKAASLHPQSVVVPGIMVDAIVIDEEQSYSGGQRMNPVLTGRVRMPLSRVDPLPLDMEKVILRRAAKEVGQAPKTVNLGVGMPVGVPRIIVEEGLLEGMTFFPEHGSLGGVPGDRAIFGTNINPEAIIDPTDVFGYFRGGGLDISFLGCGQLDRHGNVNVSKFSGIVPGFGGFIDIAHRTKILVFCGTFTSGGLATSIKNGQLSIEKEGRFRKIVPEVEQITLSGKNAVQQQQRVIYVTERCVFELAQNGIVLTEVAPGVDVNKHITSLIDFPIEVSPRLKMMDKELFV
jgi:propionate CoA-transferase